MQQQLNPLINFEYNYGLWERNKDNTSNDSNNYPNQQIVYRFSQYDNKIEIGNSEQKISKYCQFLFYKNQQYKHEKKWHEYFQTLKQQITKMSQEKLQCFQDYFAQDNQLDDSLSSNNSVRVQNLLGNIQKANIVKQFINGQQYQPLLNDKIALDGLQKSGDIRILVQNITKELQISLKRPVQWEDVKANLMLSGLKLNSQILTEFEQSIDNQLQQNNMQNFGEVGQPLFPFAGDPVIYSDNLRDLSLNWNQLEMLFQILEETAYIEDSEHGDLSKKKSNLYILSAPTGTGKTICFLIANLIWFQLGIPKSPQMKIKYLSKLNTLVFANSSQVAKQTYLETYVKMTNLKVSFLDVYLKNNKYVLTIETNDLNQPELTLDDDYRPVWDIVVVGGITTRVCKYLVKDDVFIDMMYLRRSGFLGQILITSLHFYQFMERFGIIDFTNQIENIIYDEVDVYYQFSKLDEFHKYFSKKYTNLHANNIIFSSATISPNLININDCNLSNNHMIMNEIKIQHELSQQDFVFKIITPSTTYSISDMVGATQIFQNFRIQGGLYCYFNLQRGLFDYASFAIGKTKIHFKDKVNEVYDIFDEVSLFKWILKNYNIVLLTNQKLRYLPFLQQNRIKQLRQQYTVNTFTQYQPSISCSIQKIKITEIEEFVKYVQQTNEKLRKKTVFLVFNEPLIKYIMNKLTITSLLQSQDDKIKQSLIQKIIKTDDKFIKLNTPFYNQLCDTIQGSENKQIFAEDFVTFADFVRVSRGVDIKKLDEIVVFVPSCVQFQQFGFGFSEFKQAIGRVGRNGRFGEAMIVLYGDPIQQLDQNFNQDPNLNELIIQFIQMCARKRVQDFNFNTVYQELILTSQQNEAVTQNYIKMAKIDERGEYYRKLNEIVQTMQI